MKTNENPADRAFRIIVGLGILSLLFWGPHTLWGLVGLIPLITGVVGVCPVYRMFHVSTCSTGKVVDKKLS